ncbi:hypothetical protein RO3G_14512 [Rhizopus delemar RA 99-880]|uniref:Uncharacterized protein n=1 Tax=Rhizopus delemar (strain RA 99-880 / ATCC MYA-4621 / FGSC 9543 / NRRL 43880) TaxID=246409 RepID=I1CMX1_RHIO9|nr:hypothetical protein RO3G_14512 [Rhizopus delemar RA 99-880]|eukprot:EIE89801.1 hypothetical protein RO3G_14512 [Rhizopus delemar RA 99-880]
MAGTKSNCSMINRPMETSDGLYDITNVQTRLQISKQDPENIQFLSDSLQNYNARASSGAIALGNLSTGWIQ